VALCQLDTVKNAKDKAGRSRSRHACGDETLHGGDNPKKRLDPRAKVATFRSCAIASAQSTNGHRSPRQLYSGPRVNFEFNPNVAPTEIVPC
jgi:hypothetical protein